MAKNGNGFLIQSELFGDLIREDPHLIQGIAQSVPKSSFFLPAQNDIELLHIKAECINLVKTAFPGETIPLES